MFVQLDSNPRSRFKAMVQRAALAAKIEEVQEDVTEKDVKRQKKMFKRLHSEGGDAEVGAASQVPHRCLAG